MQRDSEASEPALNRFNITTAPRRYAHLPFRSQPIFGVYDSQLKKQIYRDYPLDSAQNLLRLLRIGSPEAYNFPASGFSVSWTGTALRVIAKQACLNSDNQPTETPNQTNL